jgi:hypothetical protein
VAGTGSWLLAAWSGKNLKRQHPTSQSGVLPVNAPQFPVVLIPGPPQGGMVVEFEAGGRFWGRGSILGPVETSELLGLRGAFMIPILLSWSSATNQPAGRDSAIRTYSGGM